LLEDLLPKQKKLKSVFVIGRDIQDLTAQALSKFTEVPQRKISLLKLEDIVKLVRWKEGEILNWQPEAIDKVQQLTNGHPFFVQLLCQQVFIQLYSNKGNSNNSIPTVTSKDVEKIIPVVLQVDLNNWEYIWDGLPPAGKVVASALAEAVDGAMTIETLFNHILDADGIALIMRELQEVPKLLQDWDLIELVEKNGYRFRVELLRLWIREYKSLDETQQELDYLNPAADILYQAGLALYNYHQKPEAVAPLRQAINLNSSHIKANQLLADIFLGQNQKAEAREILEKFHKYNPRAATPRLIIVYMALAKNSERDQEKLKFYEKVLKLEPNHSEAKKQQQEISERLEAKYRPFIELVKKFILAYQKRLIQLMAFFVSLGVSYFLPVGFPSNLLFEMENANNNYQLKSVPSSERHSLVSIQITIADPNAQPKEATFKYENYKPVVLTQLANTETSTYQIDSVLLKLKKGTFQYPFFEKNKPTPSPLIFIFQFDNSMAEKVDFKCKANDPTGEVGCAVKLEGYGSLLRGIPWWMVGTLFGFLLFIGIEIIYAWKNRERDDVF
jgi:tetratricopeptide (TPR) repeat protein